MTTTNTVGTMSAEQMKAEIDRLRAENAKLAAKRGAPGKTIRRSAKGGVSVYGLGRFPVTLYREQWEALLGAVGEQVKATLAAEGDKLKGKDESVEAYLARAKAGGFHIPGKDESVSDADETNGAAAAGIPGAVKAGVSGTVVIRREPKAA
jgi:hypothetical protein